MSPDEEARGSFRVSAIPSVATRWRWSPSQKSRLRGTNVQQQHKSVWRQLDSIKILLESGFFCYEPAPTSFEENQIRAISDSGQLDKYGSLKENHLEINNATPRINTLTSAFMRDKLFTQHEAAPTCNFQQKFQNQVSRHVTHIPRAYPEKLHKKKQKTQVLKHSAIHSPNQLCPKTFKRV